MVTPTLPESDPATIRVRGARVHNLQNINLDIPRDRLVVLTGLSGSGKSSLAFDTLFAEGQRQYIESLSVYARQFFDQLEHPDVDSITGLPPTLCISQQAGSQNPRSTVATVTEIYDYLRLLMSRVGNADCYQCGRPIQQQTVEQIRDRLIRLPEGTKIILLAPLVRGRRGQHRDTLQNIRKAGFVRARIDGEVHDIENAPILSTNKLHHIDAVVDRIIIRPGVENRLTESIQLAVKHGEGTLIACCHVKATESSAASSRRTWNDELFSIRYACPDCEISYDSLEPRTFSFNNPHGACPECEGIGTRVVFDAGLVLPNLETSLAGGAILPWKDATKAQQKTHEAELDTFLKNHQIDWHAQLSEIDPQITEALLHGDSFEFLGVLTLLEKEFATTTQRKRIEQLKAFRARLNCHTCHGSRLRIEARHVRIGDKTIHDITQLSIGDARKFFTSLEVEEKKQFVARPIIVEIQHRLKFLEQVGVDYLTLDRSADTLSGGELQRVRLATSIGSGLVGVCYILDEPSVGLHPRDNERLIQALRDLQQQGNTVLVVEHDEAIMRASDELIDIGPEAGIGGGKVIAQGSLQEVMSSPDSVTGKYLLGEDCIPVPCKRRRVARTRSIVLQGVRTNNLQNVDVSFPLGVFVCVTGVSGSGKSSLINETLVPAVSRRLQNQTRRTNCHTSLRGVHHVDKLVAIDQSPIGRTTRSSLVTYTGIFDEIRKVFKGTREARQRGYGVGRFSFNVKGGRCEACQGHGTQKIEMNFLPDLFVTCNVCRGARFNQQTLQIRFRKKSIADYLQMSVDQAIGDFENIPTIHRQLEILRQVGLGYLPLGQPATTLSGGEAQRIKLATQLARVDTGKTLYSLDEPTTGLHFQDIKKLLIVLGQLVDKGNTVIVIEHNLDVIKSADWVIDLGPEGGAEGGQIMASGTPEYVATVPESHTGCYLRPYLGNHEHV